MTAVNPKHRTTDGFRQGEDQPVGKAGLLGAGQRLDLPGGDIIEVASISSAHAAAVDRLTLLLVLRLQQWADVRVQSPVRLDELSEARPDLALLRPRPDFYAAGHPRPADVLLLIEVADTTLKSDAYVKRRLYAAAGIGEVWIIDLERGVVAAASDPGTEGYRHVNDATRGGHISPVVMSEVTFAVDDLLG